MSDKTKKKKVRLNVIDVLIILLVIALIATVVYRVYTGINNKTSPVSSKYVITFECDDAYDSMLQYLDKGTAVYFADSGKLLGHMYAPEANGEAVYVIDKDAEDPSKSANKLSYTKVTMRGYITMSSETVKVKSAGYYSIGETNVSVGSRINVYTNDAVFTLTVKSIDSK
ncbi:MAG: DUF4330 family protein [Ruminococcaceae bacterium]|nr:DUF4330 family protein [Oscillospiraceae bacterium]